MREERFFTAEETVTNERIDKFLSAQMPDRSRSYIQKLIKDGLVEVNGKQVKTNYKLGSEDEVKLQIPDWKCRIFCQRRFLLTSFMRTPICLW